MPTVNLYAVTATPSTGTWTNPANATGAGSAGSYAVWTSAVANDWGRLKFHFDTSSIPRHATINSVTYTMKHNVQNTTNMLASRSTVYDGKNFINNTNTMTLSTSTGTSNTYTITPTLAQLRSGTFHIWFDARKANNTTSSYGRIDWCYLTIDYTDGALRTLTADPWTVIETKPLTANEGQIERAAGTFSLQGYRGDSAVFFAKGDDSGSYITYNYPGEQIRVDINPSPYVIAGAMGTSTKARADVAPVAADLVPVLTADNFNRTLTDFTGAKDDAGNTWKVAKSGTASVISTSNWHLRCDLNGDSWVDAHLDLGQRDGRWGFLIGDFGDGGLHICCYRAAEGNELLIGEYNGAYTIRDWGPGGSTYQYLTGTPKIKSGDAVYVHVENGWVKIWINGVLRRDAAIQWATGGSEYGFRWDTGAWGTTYRHISAEPAQPPVAEVAAPPAAKPYVFSHTTAAVPASTADKSIARPALAVTGDMLLMVLTTSSGSAPSLPSGFTQLSSHTIDTSNPTTLVGYKITTESEPTSYTPTIPSGISYRGDLFAITDHGNIAPSTTHLASDGTASASTKWVLNWDAVTGATDYTVEHRPSGGATTTVTATGTTVELTGLTAATTYEARVRANNADGSSAFTAWASFTTS